MNGPPPSRLSPGEPVQAASPEGPPVWSSRRPLVIGFAWIAVLVVGFGAWGFMASLSGAVIASGQVEVEQNRQAVQHIDGGIVDDILIREGARVEAGDVLMRLDGAALGTELAIVTGQLSDTLARRARLEAERDGAPAPDYPAALRAEALTNPEVADQIDGQNRLFNARLESIAKETEQLGRRIDQTRAQIDGIDAQSLALRTQLDLIRQELANQQTLLDKGLAQAGTVLALEREEARLMGQIGELASTRAQAEDRITEIEIQMSRLLVIRREQATTELREIGPVELELAERRRALEERIARLDIRAPVSGVVMGLTVTTPGAVIRPAEALLYLVPQDRPLLIATQVPPIHIDEVRVGQPVELVFSAFSSRETPHLNGKVSMISADAFMDQATRASFYRVEIVLDEGEIAKLGDQALLPGMPVEAFLQTEARSPIAYLVKPFTDYFSRAFRES